MEVIKNNMDKIKTNQEIIQYTLQISALNKLKKLNQINEDTYEKIKKNLKKYYSVS